MNNGKKVILHLVFDNILFDRVYPRFEEMDKYENRYLLCDLGKNRKLSFIKKIEKLIIVDTEEEWGSIVSDPTVDIVYLHGLWQSYLRAIDYIRDDVVVMWWCYGMEIYENALRWPPLLPLKLYKPKTHWFCLTSLRGWHFLSSELSFFFPHLYILIIRLFNLLTGKRSDLLKRMLSRIDYAFTPLEIEFVELKKRHPYIKALRYTLTGLFKKIPLENHVAAGGILLEHSANTTNNHLDIIASIKKKGLDLHERSIYVPLGYGEKKLAEKVRKEARFEGAKVQCLMDSIPFSEYSEMMSGCTHAIFGMIRQSGLGNIYSCFQKGIKVFFYKDSILYKHFKAEGYHVFTIEEELNNTSIREPLTSEQAQNNYDRFYARFSGSSGNYQQQLDSILNNSEYDKH